MSVIIRLQGLPWTASAMNIRHFFSGLSIPAGGVHIIGGEGGDAFIAFSSDDDARVAMKKNLCSLNDTPVQLFLSSKSEMQSVIDAARSGVPAVPAASSPQTVMGTSGGVSAGQTNMPTQQQRGNFQQNMPMGGGMDMQNKGGMQQGNDFNNPQWQGYPTMLADQGAGDGSDAGQKPGSQPSGDARFQGQYNNPMMGQQERMGGFPPVGGGYQGGPNQMDPSMGGRGYNNMQGMDMGGPLGGQMNQMGHNRGNMMNQGENMDQQGGQMSQQQGRMGDNMNQGNFFNNFQMGGGGGPRQAGPQGDHQGPFQGNMMGRPDFGQGLPGSGQNQAGFGVMQGRQGPGGGGGFMAATDGSSMNSMDNRGAMNEPGLERNMSQLHGDRQMPGGNQFRGQFPPDRPTMPEFGPEKEDRMGMPWKDKPSHDMRGPQNMGDRQGRDMHPMNRMPEGMQKPGFPPDAEGRLRPGMDQRFTGPGGMFRGNQRPGMFAGDTREEEFMPSTSYPPDDHMDIEAEAEEQMPGRFPPRPGYNPEEGSNMPPGRPGFPRPKQEGMNPDGDRDSFAKYNRQFPPMGRFPGDTSRFTPGADERMGRFPPPGDHFPPGRRPGDNPFPPEDARFREREEELRRREGFDRPLQGDSMWDRRQAPINESSGRGMFPQDRFPGDRAESRGADNHVPAREPGRRGPSRWDTPKEDIASAAPPTRPTPSTLGLKPGSTTEPAVAQDKRTGPFDNRAGAGPTMDATTKPSMPGALAGLPADKGREGSQGKVEPDAQARGSMERKGEPTPDRGLGLKGMGGPGFQGREPGFEDRGPGFEGRGPGFEGRGPGFENKGPGFENRGPGFEGRGPGFENRGSGFENRGPGYENRGPRFENRGPRFEDRGPGFENRGPGFEGRRPEFEGMVPGFGGKPGFEGRGSGFEDREPELKGRGSGFENVEPEFKDRRPGFENAGSEFEGKGPGFERRGPGFERMGSEFDGNRPGFEGRGPGFEGRRSGFEGRRPGFDNRGFGFEGPRRPGFEGRGPEYEDRGEFKERETGLKGRGSQFEDRGPEAERRRGDFGFEGKQSGFERGRGLGFEERDGPDFEGRGRPEFQRRDAAELEGRDREPNRGGPPFEERGLMFDERRLRPDFEGRQGPGFEDMRGMGGDRHMENPDFDGRDPELDMMRGQNYGRGGMRGRGAGRGGPPGMDRRHGFPDEPFDQGRERGPHMPFSEEAMEDFDSRVHGRGGPMFDRSFRGRGDPFFRGRGGPPGPFGRGRGIDVDRFDDGGSLDVDARNVGGRPDGPPLSAKPRGLLGDAPLERSEGGPDGRREDGDERRGSSRSDSASRRDSDNRGSRRSHDRDRDRRHDDRRGRDHDDRRYDRDRYRYTRDRSRRSRSRSRDRSRERDRFSSSKTGSPRTRGEGRERSLVLKNMSKTLSYKDVRRFLQPVDIPFDGLKIINDEKGERIGVAYVQLRRSDDVSRVLRRNGTKMGTNTVSISTCSDEEFSKAVDSFVPPRDKDLPPVNVADIKLPPAPAKEKPANPDKTRYILQLQNLPQSVTRCDIVQFLQGVTVMNNGEAAYIEFDASGAATGMGFVELKSDLDYKKALTFNGSKIGANIVKVFPGNIEEADDLKGKQVEMLQRAALRSLAGGSKATGTQPPRLGVINPLQAGMSQGNVRPQGQAESGQPRPQGPGNQQGQGQPRPEGPGKQQVQGQLRPQGPGNQQVQGQPRPQGPGNQQVQGQPRPQGPGNQQNQGQPRPQGPGNQVPGQQRPQGPGNQPIPGQSRPQGPGNQQGLVRPPFTPQKGPQTQQQQQSPQTSQSQSPVKSASKEESQGAFDTVCVHIQGLPLLATPQDIRMFFTDSQIALRGINIAHDSRGKPLGEGFVEFRGRADFEKGLKKDKTSLGRHIVAVKPIRKKEMLERLGLTRQKGQSPPEKLEEAKSPSQLPMPNSSQSNPQKQQKAPPPSSPVTSSAGPPPQNNGQQQARIPQQPSPHHLKPLMGGPDKAPMMHPPNLGGPDKGPMMHPPNLGGPDKGPMMHPPNLGGPGPVGKTIPAGVLNQNWFYVRCQNFPPDISIAEIMHFFMGFRPFGDSIRLHYSSDGRPTGNAVVGFGSREEAHRALASLNMKPCRQNIIRLFPA